MTLESMNDFFTRRIADYEIHMKTAIAYADRFYPETAALLPLMENVRLLDLGCGTGLELDEIFARCPSARVTGIDLCPAMLAELRKKPYADRLTLIEGSYFDAPLGENQFDGAVSVESLHHFTAARKLPLYARIHAALRPGGVYVETDYAARDDAEEARCFSEYARLTGGARAGDFHFDTPLTAAHTIALLKQAGFAAVEQAATYGNTALLAAKKAAL